MKSFSELCILAMLLANSMAVNIKKQSIMEYVPGQESYIPQQEHAFALGTPEQFVALEESGIKFWEEGSSGTTVLIIVLVVILVIILLIVCCCCCACCAIAGAQAEAQKKKEEEDAQKMMMSAEPEAAPMMEGM